MSKIPTLLTLTLLITNTLLITGCSAEVGSERWCTNMKETPKGDWTASQAKDYGKHCLFKKSEE